jgi:serine protease Do
MQLSSERLECALDRELKMKQFSNSRPMALKQLGMLGIIMLLSAALPCPAESQDPVVAFVPSLASVSDEVKCAVANISATQNVDRSTLERFTGTESPLKEFFGEDLWKRFFDSSPQESIKTRSLGSGVLIDEDGHILTNSHVIEGADQIKVTFEGEQEYDAKLVGIDPKTDIALIKVEPRIGCPRASALGDSDAIRVGDWVMAVGNPYGLGHTVTVGIISAKGRVIGAGMYDDFLQTDAAINPGNSGGPLFNLKGEVVGINTAIVAQGHGIGFAIPINMAKEILPQLRNGKVVRGWLGVMVQDITPELADAAMLKEAHGVLVTDVMNASPAGKAGLRNGDVVTQINGINVENSHALSKLVAGLHPGTKAPVTILRNGNAKTMHVTIGAMPDEEQRTSDKAAFE